MGTLAIPAGAIVYVDANALLYAVERVEPYATLLRPAWEAARSGTARLVASELLIIETLTGPLKRRDRALAAAYEQVFGAKDIELLPVSAVPVGTGGEDHRA